jgi:signal transduction histidine kinase
VRHNLLLTLKEALNNVVKHANATEVFIRVAVEPELFTLTVTDNGRGMPAELIAVARGDVASVRPDGNGLRNMRQRIESIGGRFELRRPAGGGTEVTVTLRIQPQ